MKNLLKNKNTEMNFSNLTPILTSGAAAGMAIANHLGKNAQTGGIIGVGLSLLVTGIITALDDEVANPNTKN
ncbi:hypothetical protein [Flavobacterium sp. IB48]|uniref:hypothetical protein n=1 Tax=Flavobacterium sp. IB48 TaxID=2779375 RepID=UPI0018E6EFD9|nr:hypothetical protein [Flavobacterium sp. IB48]MBJ2124849.1 hypothetical protein [Flavobacterium sp. IB48]